MGNFSSLNIGMTALRAFKSYQDIIGNNIANVSNKNYKRRDGVLEPLRVSDSVYGGVDLVRIKRTVDYFAERDVRNSVSDYEKNNYMYHIFSKLEGKINVLDESSVYSALSSFWEALDELSKTPSDITLKNSCVSKGRNLCVSIKNVIDNNLRTEQDIFNTAQNDIKLINNKLKQIADLNQKIIETETIGLESNSLRDARDGILEELSEYFDFDMIEDKNGYRISVNGISVVNGKDFYEIKAEISGGAYKKIDYSIPKYNQNISFSLGKLSAYADSIKEIGDINSSFDKIIKSLVSTEPESINYIHRNGYDSNGGLCGKDFFVLNSKGELDINPDIVSDPSLFAASKQP
ncbi:MAG: flagellar basal body protein, partial [Elusimicrobiales bacterium]|nr:flagellar basal body protein [Elusimicrobiales bacterium]